MALWDITGMSAEAKSEHSDYFLERDFAGVIGIAIGIFIVLAEVYQCHTKS